jgi:hypothetical protein
MLEVFRGNLLNQTVMTIEANAATLKNELHRLVVQTDDEEVLLQIKFVFEFLLHEDAGSDWWTTLSDNEQMLVQKALLELDSGDRIPHEAVRLEINQMLGK